MNTVVLHGELGKKFGRRFELDVKTPAEAVRAIGMMREGFFDAIRGGSWRVVQGKVRTGRDLGAEELLTNTRGEIHILPAPSGGKRRGGVKVVVGAVLLAAALVTVVGGGIGLFGFTSAGTAQIAGGSGIAASLAGGMTYIGMSAGQVGLLGLSLAFAGISALIAPMPKAVQPQDQRASFLMGGPINQASQGIPVPLVFGKTRTGTVVISYSMEIEDKPS